MMRISLLALGLSLVFGLNGWAQSREQVLPEEAKADDAPQVSMAALEMVPTEIELATPPVSDEALATKASGTGYYSAPNSDAEQTFEIIDHTTLPARADAGAKAGGTDNDRGKPG